MSDENTASGTGFKCDVNLFFEGVNNANAAKSSVRNTIETANSMTDIEGMGAVISELNNCNVDSLIAEIEEARDRILALDSDFANQYFKLLQTYIKGLDPETLGEDYVTQYIASEKEYWNTLVAMLKKNEDSLSPYMKKQLDIARAMAGYYNVTDKMGANDVGIDELEKLYDERKNYEIDLLKLKGLSEDALDKAIAELNEKYELAIAGAECNDAYKQALKLDINDENYQDSYINFIKKQADYQIKLVESNKDLTDEEKAEIIAGIRKSRDESETKVKLSVVSNEFNNLDITADDYEEKSKNLLKYQKYYTKKLYRSDTSLTPEQLEEKLKELDSQYDSLFLAVESAKIQSDIDTLNVDAEDYEERRLALLNDYKDCTAEQLKLAGLTDEQIQEQLALIDVEITQTQGDIEWKNTSAAGKAWQYAQSFTMSFYTGILGVGENIVDGLAMAVGPWLFDEEDVAEFVKTDYSEKAYASWAKSWGVNDHAAYSFAHTAGNFVGSAVGYALISAATGGIFGAGTVAAVAATSLVGGLAAGGSASERVLNSGATFDEALNVGISAFALGAISGTLSGALTSSIPSSMLGGQYYSLSRYALMGGMIGAIEPAINPAIEYNVYAKHLKDENGDSLYSSWADYYVESGALMNILLGFAGGSISTARDYKDALDKKTYLNPSNGSKKSEKSERNKNTDFEVETEAYKQGDLLDDGLDAPMTKAPEIEVETEAYKQGDLLGDGLDVDPTAARINDEINARINLDLEVESISPSYESINEAIKNYAHSMSTATDFKALDDSIDLYYTNITKKVTEYDSWNIVQARYENKYPDWSELPDDVKNFLIKINSKRLVDAIDNAPGASYIDKLRNSVNLTDDELNSILTDKELNSILSNVYGLTYTAVENGKFALTGVDGAPNSHVTIEDYYHDISLKDQGLLNSHTTQAYTDYVKNGYINSNGTNTVSSIYANDNLKYAINIPGEEDADILQISMWDRKPIIEVDMNGKSFGRSGERQFVSPISDSDQLFSSIQNAKSPVDTQEVVGAATGLPTSGNDRLTRISLDTTEQVAIHNGKESGSCKEALSGGLPVYEVDGINHKMREATIEAINFGQSNLSKSNFIVDNFDPKTGALISKYKLIVTENGKTILVLLQ